MPDRKIFAGARLRRLRQRLGLSQSEMAARVGLSPSYLNLIERNQRPLTVQVLLKLSATFDVNVGELAGGEEAVTVEAVKEVFSDPLLAGELPGPGEAAELCEVAPNAARAIARLHAAYREALERLSDLSYAMAADRELPAEPTARLPQDRVAAHFEAAGPWFEALEAAAHALAATLVPRDDPQAALRAALKERFSVEVRVMPLHVMPVEQARFDRHSMRLFLSERVALIDRAYLMARQVALLGHSSLLDDLAGSAGLDDQEAVRVCRLAFARRFAEAVLVPAGRLRVAIQDLGWDIQRLADRFAVRPSVIMARMAALGEASQDALPASFLLTIDPAGAVIARQPGAGYPFPRYGALCARLPVFDPRPAGRVTSGAIEMAAFGAFAVASVCEDWNGLPESVPPPRRLTMIGWRLEDAPEAYRNEARPVGVTCRLCERFDCPHRTQPAVTRPGGFQEHVVGAAEHATT